MRLCQLEFRSSNIMESALFVEAVLGWKRVPVSMNDQIIIEVPDDSPYGISLRPTKGGKSESSLLAYFESKTPLTNLREIITSAGGRILVEPMIITGYGFAMIAEDPAGLNFGFYEAHFQAPKPR